MQSSNLFHIRCVVSLGRLLRSIMHLPMLMFLEHTTTSSNWSSSNKCKSNCSSHLARGDVLLLYFSFPSLQKTFIEFTRQLSNYHVCKSYLNLTNGSSPASASGKPFASTNRIVTTELHICDFKRFDASASLGFRWKYWKYVKVFCYNAQAKERRKTELKRSFFVDFTTWLNSSILTKFIPRAG